jgi:hypothetical protein
MNVLVIDVDGPHVKILASGPQEHRDSEEHHARSGSV